MVAAVLAIEGNAKATKGGWQWTTAPRPGDLVLFTVGGGANHVGIVEAVGQAGVVTIEGNTHKDYDPGRFWEGYGVFRRHHRAGRRRSAATPAPSAAEAARGSST